MTPTIAAFDARLKILKAHYTDPVLPMEARHILDLFELVELMLLSVALDEKKLEKEVG